MADLSPDTLAAELDMFLARAGTALPAERRDAVLGGYADFRAQMDLLHAARPATEEPANIFRPSGAAR